MAEMRQMIEAGTDKVSKTAQSIKEVSMIFLVIGAIFRALAVAMAISVPSIVLITGASDGSSITLIAALIAGALICLEYLNTYPSM